MHLHELVALVGQRPDSLQLLQISVILGFVQLVYQLYPTILWLEFTRHRLFRGPVVQLHINVISFLSAALRVDAGTVVAMWCGVRGSIAQMQFANPLKLFLRYGPTYDLAYKNFFPPYRQCINDDCSGYLKKGYHPVLKEARQHKASLFTLADGVVPVHTTSLYCRHCHTRFHFNMSVRMDPSTQQRLRTYYFGPVPEYIQVEKHIFMETKLCELFKNLAVFSHVAATSMSRTYNQALCNTEQMPSNWARAVLDSYVVSDSFDLYALLQHHAEYRTQLIVPHVADSQAARLSAAMNIRNQLMSCTGQEYYAHACKLCMDVKEREGQLYKVHVAVSDGIVMGHPCCGVHDCQEDLVTNRDKFCDPHGDLASRCGVVGCEEEASEGHRTCSDVSHRAMEEHYTERGRAMFQLKARLQNAGIAIPDEAYGNTERNDDDLEEDFEAEVPVQNGGNCEEKPETGNRKLRARFGRRRTHNEQLLVRPCGVIMSRATFFGSEGLRDVGIFWKASCPTPQSVPNIIMYDTNCLVQKHFDSIGETHFANCGLPVDVFHFKCKHKESDAFCAERCNPAAFPDLYDENGDWRFNSSAAEQTNVWFGGFRANVREMRRIRYNFYLDEMIKHKNRFTVKKLEKDGHAPFLIPWEELFPSGEEEQGHL